ncbi:argininosuccinate synthase domain-containing protein [Aliikangiella sp. IMCC44632]
MTNNTTISSKTNNQLVVLAFSGGLDTSFCVPYLIEKGYQVVTAFIDSGGISQAEKAALKARALQLGAIQHREISIVTQLWEQVVTPLIYADHWYQNQYPLLCSDRYLIVESCLKLCDELNTCNFAHGCTGMGNDQVRFDISVACLGEYRVISPIRAIQKITDNVRNYELEYLQAKGFSVSQASKAYSINQNCLGVTLSGSEIDHWQAPASSSYVLCQQPNSSNIAHNTLQPAPVTSQIKLEFKQGQLIRYNQQLLAHDITPAELLKQLNQLGGRYSIGRGIYTGDTTIGLKGRIVFEAPALSILHAAHRALEECVNSKAQNRFKATVAEKWCELVYEGLFYDPLKTDLQAYLTSTQKQVSGTVTLELSLGSVLPIAIESANILANKNATYAQSSDWNIQQAEGFIKLFGQSTKLACLTSVNKTNTCGAA